MREQTKYTRWARLKWHAAGSTDSLQKFDFIKRVHKGRITTVKDLESFCFHLAHRRSTTVSLETRNPFTDKFSL